MHSPSKDFLRGQTALLWDIAYRPINVQPPSNALQERKISVTCLSGFCLNKHPAGLPGTSFSAPAEKHLFPILYAFR